LLLSFNKPNDPRNLSVANRRMILDTRPRRAVTVPDGLDDDVASGLNEPTTGHSLRDFLALNFRHS